MEKAIHQYKYFVWTCYHWLWSSNISSVMDAIIIICRDMLMPVKHGRGGSLMPVKQGWRTMLMPLNQGWRDMFMPVSKMAQRYLL